MNAALEQTEPGTPRAPSGIAAAPNRFFTLPNMLSLVRLALAIPFALLMLSSLPGARLWACVVLAIGVLTDNLDGRIARRLGVTSEWGRILDPLADKVGAATAVIVLLVLQLLPLWFVILMVGRDVLILAGGLYIRSARGVVLPPNNWGKWTIGFISLVIFLALIEASPTLTAIGLAATTVMLAVSFSLYVKRFLEVVR